MRSALGPFRGWANRDFELETPEMPKKTSTALPFSKQTRMSFPNTSFWELDNEKYFCVFPNVLRCIRSVSQSRSGPENLNPLGNLVLAYGKTKTVGP